MRTTLLVAAATLALGACKDQFPNDNLELAVQATGANASLHSGVTVGIVHADMAKTPVVGKDGQLLKVAGPCKTEQPLSSYSILEGQATASANGSGPQAAVAANRMSAVGEAAVQEALADVARVGGSPAADVERARLDCSKSIPQQAPGNLAPAAAAPASP
jgi:hypothetical protein